jgi:hypothetical protein
MQSNPIPHRSRDILLLLFSLIGIIVLAGRGIFLAVNGIVTFDNGSIEDLTSSLFGAFGLFLCAALLSPLLKWSIRRLRGQVIPQGVLQPVKFWQIGTMIGVWLFSLTIGSILLSLPGKGQLISLPFFLMGISIPIAGLVWIAVGGLPASSRRRLWASFGIGMIGSTLGAAFFEYSIVGIVALFAFLVAANNPQWQAIFQQIKSQVTSTGDMQSLLTALAPYLTNPLVLLGALLFVAVLTPIIEETLKPAAVWLLGRRLHSVAEGFVLGALCGAGFAMLEGTIATSMSTQMLGVGIAARAASSLMHITASGIMGWGIASAYLEKRYGRLALAYFISVSIHGLWNGSVILAVFGGLRLAVAPASLDLIGIMLVLAGIGILGSMVIAIVVLLPVFNRRLRSITIASDGRTQSDIIAPPHP